MYSLTSLLASLKPFLLMGLLIGLFIFDGASVITGFLQQGGGRVHAAGKVEITTQLLSQVMPGADSFSGREGEVPVYRAYASDPVSSKKQLIGYVYFSADVPPKATGFSGSIDVLVGLNLEGTIVGFTVVDYRESLRNTWGDFLSEPGFQEQFVGKHAADKFRVYEDVDGIAQATITVRAMSKGIRQSIRQVANAYLR